MTDGKAALSMPLRTETAIGGRATLFIDARGMVIGGCYGEHHREHAETMAGVLNIVLAGPQGVKLN